MRPALGSAALSQPDESDMATLPPPIRLVDEVERFLRGNETRYVALLDEIKQLFWPPGLLPVRNVYSRKEKQGDSELKDVKKIARALHYERQRVPHASVSSIDDIVGMTVVCDYLSDLESLKSFVRKQRGHGGLRIDKDKQMRKDGYYAHHFVVQHPRFADLRCELQIKTMLHNTWSIKAHRLIYKPAGALDYRAKKLMQAIGDGLQAVDQQTDLLRSIIEDHWDIDNQRRVQTRQAIISTLAIYKNLPKKIFEAATSIRTSLDTDREHLATAESNDPKLVDVIDSIRALSQMEGAHLASGHLMAILALNRDDRDLNIMVVNFLDHWIANRRKVRDQLNGLMLKGLFLNSIGDTVEAIVTIRRAIEMSDKKHQTQTKPFLQNQLAYFLADLQGLDRTERRIAAAEAKDLVKQIRSALGDKPYWLLDTDGAIKIAFGNSERQIEKGLLLCEAAKNKAPPEERPVSDAFFKLHQQRAWQRLLMRGFAR